MVGLFSRLRTKRKFKETLNTPKQIIMEEEDSYQIGGIGQIKKYTQEIVNKGKKHFLHF